MSTNVIKGYRGYMYLKKIDGDGPLLDNEEVLIPYMEAAPEAPYNDTYMPVVNKATGPSIIVRGKITPSISVRTIAKPSWFTADLINSMLLTRDANFDTDVFAAKLVELGESAPTVYDTFRVGGLSLSHNAAGGPLGVEFSGIAATSAGVTVFTGTGEADAGLAYDAAAVDYNSTAELVRAWRLNLMCPQSYDMFSNRSRYPSGVSTGQISGTLELEFSSKAAVVPTSTMTIRIYDSSDVLQITLTVNLNLDVPRRIRSVGLGNKIHAYTLINSSTGAIPVTAA